MARGQIAKPEFYVDYFIWLNTIGSLDYNEIIVGSAFAEEGARQPLVASLLRLDPNVASHISFYGYEGIRSGFQLPTGLKIDLGNDHYPEETDDSVRHIDHKNWNIDYVAFLNHNFNSAKCSPRINFKASDDAPEEAGAVHTRAETSNIINFEGIGDDLHPEYDGYSVASIDTNPEEYNIEKLGVTFGPSIGEDTLASDLFLGSLSIGHKYTPPTSPDLKVTMTYDVGYKRKDTVNGRKVAHLNWFRERGWYQFETNRQSFNFEKIDSSGHRFNFRKSGRRTWKVSWSFISDDNMFPSNINTQVHGMYDSTLEDGDGENVYELSRTLMGDNSMVAQLLHKTCFGYLPFLFRCDNTYNLQDAFCLAMLDMKKFQIKQVAHKFWSVNMSIVEVI